MNIQDKLLVWRFNRGDFEAVRVIYEKHKHELLALANALLRDSAVAEDVVHDVFVRFLRLRKFRLTGSLKGYLCTCVANSARNLISARNRHGEEPMQPDLASEASGRGPDAEAMAAEETRLVKEAMEELPCEQRETVALHLNGGLKFTEIAAAQQVSINTVQGRYRYGLEKLRSKLNGKVAICDRMLTLKD